MVPTRDEAAELAVRMRRAVEVFDYTRADVTALASAKLAASRHAKAGGNAVSWVTGAFADSRLAQEPLDASPLPLPEPQPTKKDSERATGAPSAPAGADGATGAAAAPENRSQGDEGVEERGELATPEDIAVVMADVRAFKEKRTRERIRRNNAPTRKNAQDEQPAS